MPLCPFGTQHTHTQPHTKHKSKSASHTQILNTLKVSRLAIYTHTHKEGTHTRTHTEGTHTDTLSLCWPPLFNDVIGVRCKNRAQAAASAN